MLTAEGPQAGQPQTVEDLKLAVRFEGDCWVLESDRRFETLVYRSGRAAEEAARRMAAQFARGGQGVRVSVEDRRHTLVGTKIYFPCDVTRRAVLSDESGGS